MKNFSIKEEIKKGWHLFKKDKVQLIVLTLAFSILTNGGNLDKLYSDIPMIFKVIIGVALAVLAIIVNIGWIKTLLKVVDGGKAEFGDLFAYSGLFFKFLGAVIMLGLAVGLAGAVGAGLSVLLWGIHFSLAMLGGLATLVAVIYLSLRFVFVAMLVVDKEEVGISEAFRVSSKMTEGIKLKLLGLCIISILLAIMGLLALVVGYLVAVPVSTLALLSVYRKALPAELK